MNIMLEFEKPKDSCEKCPMFASYITEINDYACAFTHEIISWYPEELFNNCKLEDGKQYRWNDEDGWVKTE